MVYIKPVLASAVAFTTLFATTSALPASVKRDQAASSNISNNVVTNGKRSNDGPVVVQAKSVKRGYVGGGDKKGLKQAPLVKTAKLFRSKRDIVEARDSHVHEHVHEHIDDDHDHHHHHHDGDYDHHHSEHYNFHHGLTDHDDHHHHHHDSRDFVDVSALNFNSPSNNKSKKINKINKSKKIGKINKCRGSHFHCNNHKRRDNDAADDADTEEAEDTTRLVRRRKNSSYKHDYNGDHRYSNNGKNNNGWKKNQQNSDGKVVKAQTEVSTNGIKRAPLPGGKMSPGLEVRHHHEHEDEHYHEHDHDHYHDHEDVHVHQHIHSHEHKRSVAPRHEDEHVHMHVHEDDYEDDHHHHHHHHQHNDKRRHHDHDAWLDDMTYDREYHDGHAHIHVHEHDHGHYHGHHHHHDKRQAPQTPTQSGIPGFVEVANTLAGTTLAKSVAGLVFSKGPDPNASGFLLGTSETQSTQFYLVPTQDASTIETSQSANATMESPEEAAKTYQLRIPVLDSKTFESNDYCATFDILPPSPMTMAPCKAKEGFSQIFKYNATTGELTPVYPSTPTQPKPMSAAVRVEEPQVMAAKFPVSGDQVPVSDASLLSAATGTPAASSTSSSDAAASTPADTTSSSSSSTESQSSAAPQSTASAATTEDGPAPSDGPKVSLFFIPASTYAKDSPAPATAQESTTSTTSTDGALFSPPAQGQAKIVSPSQDSADWSDDSSSDEFAGPSENQAKIVSPSNGGSETQDWTNTGGDSGTVTTTVIVTSTMDASAPQATPASESSTSDASTTETSSEGPTQ